MAPRLPRGAKAAAALLGKDEADDEDDDDDEDEADKRTVRRIERDVLRAMTEDERCAKKAKKAAPVKKPLRAAPKATPREKVTVFRGASLARLLKSVGAPRLRTMELEPIPHTRFE